MSATILLYGLDGSNPLAFLAALGTLRSLSLLWPEERVRLAWKIHDGAWRPMLQIAEPREKALICAALAKQLRPFEKHCALGIGDDLTIDAKTFGEYARQAANEAERDRTWADFASSFGCDALTRKDKNEILDTAFRTMAGAGHQHFLKSMRNICRETTAAHLEKALFSAWRYNDPLTNLSLRWDPRDDQRYALRWDDPSGDSTRAYSGSMLGANRLAIEALAFFPALPNGRTLRTTGFVEGQGQGTWFVWPIWETFIDMDVCRSLVAHEALGRTPPNRIYLAAQGVVEVFRSRRVTIGKIRSFTPAQPA
jgi:hypothetical protein